MIPLLVMMQSLVEAGITYVKFNLCCLCRLKMLDFYQMHIQIV